MNGRRLSHATRRDFLKFTALAGASTVLSSRRAEARGLSPVAATTSERLMRRPMGKTGLEVSILGVGGYHLGSVADDKQATEIVSRALAAGVNFFDSAWEYHQGLSERRLGAALRGRRDRAIVMTKVCTHGRDRKTALKMLEESLRRLGTDYLDVWQIHEVIYENDPDRIFASNGVAEALLEAKKAGKARFVGFTGHKDPHIHLRMLSEGFPFDSIQMPLNCFDATFRSFEQTVLPKANALGLAVFGMKSLGGSGEMVRSGAITAAEGLRYAMSLPVATTISGMDSLGVLEQNLAILHNFQPMTASEMEALRARCASAAADGHLELFKTTLKYDGDIGRRQHHYPTTKTLPV